MVSLLCMSDRTHSQLMELLPEKCGAPQNKDFDAILAQVRHLNVNPIPIYSSFNVNIVFFVVCFTGRRLQGT